MIQANVSSTETMVNQRATEIRFKELTLFTDNLGVIASLAAFFAETSLDALYIEPETVSKDNPRNMFSTLCWSLSAVAISLNLLTLLVSIYTMLHGPALAIRGPAGSMNLAVSRIFVQRKLALQLFWAGLLCKVVQASALAAWRYPPVVAAAVASVFASFCVATVHCIKRVTGKFSFRRFGLRRDNFIEISTFEQRRDDSSEASAAAAGSGGTASAAPPAVFNPLTTGSNMALEPPQPQRRHMSGDRHLVQGEEEETTTQQEVAKGFLMKQTSFFKRWTSRYFVLARDGVLTWSVSPGAPPRGSLDLADPNHDVQVNPLHLGDTPGVPHFGLYLTRRDDANNVTELLLATDSNESRSLWIRAVRTVRSTRTDLAHSISSSSLTTANALGAQYPPTSPRPHSLAMGGPDATGPGGKKAKKNTLNSHQHAPPAGDPRAPLLAASYQHS